MHLIVDFKYSKNAVMLRFLLNRLRFSILLLIFALLLALFLVYFQESMSHARTQRTDGVGSEKEGSRIQEIVSQGEVLIRAAASAAVAAAAAVVPAKEEHSVAAADQPPRAFVYAPLDNDFIQANFEKLKKTVAKSPIGKYQSNATSMIITKQLDLDTATWRFHTPSGKNMSLAELQEATQDKNYPVPNLAHYILPFQKPELDFHHYVCMLSGFWIMKPQKVVFWYVKPPHGHYWELLKNNMTSSEWEEKVIMVQRPVADKVYNIPVVVKEHQADIMRIEAVFLLGGAYFDLDVITLNPLEPLRKFNFTIGKELPTVVCNGVFLGRPNNTMLAMWHLTYQAFDDSSWGGHSLYLITRLCEAFQELCHIEEESLDRPGWINFSKMFGFGDRSWDWQKRNYAIHLFYRLYKIQHDMRSIRTLDNAFGDMARYVLFGRKDLLDD